MSVDQVSFDNKIEIENPIDGKIMYWYDNDFTKINFPGPNFQKEQKKSSLKYILEKGKGVLDIGAHIGDYGICMAKALTNLNREDVIVYCIDPSEYKCDFMEQVKKDNNLNNVKIICAGLTDKVGRYSVKEHGFGGTERCRRNSGGWQWTKDPKGKKFTTLDKLYENNKIGEIGFFWFDAQWSEYKIMVGGQKYLTENRPYILMEYYPCRRFHEDKESVVKVRQGTKDELSKDKKFVRLFKKYDIVISEKGSEFEDILIEFNQ